MKRVWGHVLAGSALLAIGGAAFSACVHNDSSIFVQDVLAPQEVSNGQSCTFTSATTQPVLSSGVLDVDFRYNYNPTYLVGNQLVAEANAQQLVTETSTITIQGAVVRITDAAGNQLANYTRLASGTIYPAVGGVPGYAPISVTAVIDNSTVANNATIRSTVINAPPRTASVRLVTYVRFFGNTLGGRYVESDEFEFPVDVCRGCLITFSPQDISPNAPVPNCLGNSAAGSSTAQQTLPCVVGQDLSIDCVQCQGIPDCAGAYQGGPLDGGAG